MILRLSPPTTTVALAILFSASICQSQSKTTLSLEKEIPLPGVSGRIDHLSVDLAGQRLFVSALGNGSVEIVDLKRAQVTGHIQGLKEPQGVLYVPENRKLYVACGGDGSLRTYDGASYALESTLNLGDDADNLRYDESRKEIIVGSGSGSLTGFDLNARKTFQIELSAHPEAFQIESGGARIFVNVPGKSTTNVIDRRKASVSGKWSLGGSFSNFPMALDDGDKRAFVGFRIPARLAVFDIDSGAVVAKLPMVGDSDDLFYDRTRRRIYAIGGEGFVDVFTQKDADNYERTERIATYPGSRTGLFVPSLNRLFVACPKHGSQPARILLYETVGGPK